MALRLCGKLMAIKKNMEASYGELAQYLTEIKMDHDFGKKKSPQLQEFLICNRVCNRTLITYIYASPINATHDSIVSVYPPWLFLVKQEGSH